MASNSRSNVGKEIPGYYYDSQAKRYFKIDPAHPRPVAQSTSAYHSDSAKYLRPKPTNTIDILQKRQMGMSKSSFSFGTSVVALRTNNLQMVRQFEMYFCPGPTQVTFLRGGKRCLFMELHREFTKTNSIKQKPLCPRKKSSDSKYLRDYEYRMGGRLSVVDLCEFTNPALNENNPQLVTVFRDSSQWTVGVSCAATKKNVVVVRGCTTPIWCCAANDFSSKIAWGSKNAAFFSPLPWHDTEGLEGFHSKGEVRSIELDKMGNLLYSGVHTGYIELTDCRTNKMVFSKRMHSVGIDETKLLYDENHLICGTFDGKLFNLDLRMRYPICKYLGHVHTPSRKVPFSFSEPQDLLCATGTDNVTRLWSLSSGGYPLKHIEPPKKKKDPSRSWLIDEGNRYYIKMYQNEDCFIFATEDEDEDMYPECNPVMSWSA